MPITEDNSNSNYSITINSKNPGRKLTSSKRFPIAPASSLLDSKFYAEEQSEINIKKVRK